LRFLHLHTLANRAMSNEYTDQSTHWRNEGAEYGGRPRAQPKEGAQKAEI